MMHDAQQSPADPTQPALDTLAANATTAAAADDDDAADVAAAAGSAAAAVVGVAGGGRAEGGVNDARSAASGKAASLNT